MQCCSVPCQIGSIVLEPSRVTFACFKSPHLVWWVEKVLFSTVENYCRMSREATSFQNLVFFFCFSHQWSEGQGRSGEVALQSMRVVTSWSSVSSGFEGNCSDPQLKDGTTKRVSNFFVILSEADRTPETVFEETGTCKRPRVHEPSDFTGFQAKTRR